MPSRTDDDYEDDDRPRKSRRRDDDYDAPKSKSNTKLILGIVGGVFLAFFLVCGGIGFLMFRGVQQGITNVQNAAQNMQQTNNLKQIGIAFHSQADAGTGLTGPYAVDKNSVVRQGLSFRVGLLPYIEQDVLYRRYDMTKAWDAGANATLSQTVVPQFAGPATPGVLPTVQSPYRLFYGGGAMFEADGKPVPLTSVTDGLSNTIMVVSAAETVPWAKPQEFSYSKTTPLPSLLVGSNGKHLVLLGDGSTRFVSPTISQTVLRQAIEKADGNVVMWPGE